MRGELACARFAILIIYPLILSANKIYVGAYVFGFFQLSGTLDLSTDVPRDPAAAVQRVAATRETEALTLVAAPEAASNVATASATDLSARETTYAIRGLQKMRQYRISAEVTRQ